MNVPLLRIVPGLIASLLISGIARAETSYDTIELIPEDRAGWTVTNLFAPITGLFMGGPGYWYSDRKIRVETTPPGAALDLFYVRRNFQKGYEQADAPVEILLPPRRVPLRPASAAPPESACVNTWAS